MSLIIPKIVLPRLKRKNVQFFVMDLVGSCALAFQWDLSGEDLHDIKKNFENSNNFLNQEINVNNLGESFFTVVQYYLIHIEHMIKDQGPLKAHNCRFNERTIKKFKNLIPAKTEPGENASNVLENYTSYLLYQEEDNATTPKSRDIYMKLPGGDENAPQLWDKTLLVELSNETAEMYNIRLLGVSGENLESNNIEITPKMWADFHVFSSLLNAENKTWLLCSF